MKNRYPLSETLHDVFSALLTRKSVAIIIGISIGLFVAFLYLNALFAWSVIDDASRRVSPAQLQKVTISITSNTNSNGEGFTEPFLRRLRTRPGVISAEELFEVTVNIRRKDDTSGFGKQTVIESAGKDEPTFGKDMLLCGKVLDDEKQIVLGKALADNLAIESPGQQVIIRLERTSNTVIEPLEVVFTVSGIVKGEDRCYALTSIVKSFDLWALHSTKTFGEENQSNVAANCLYAIAYVPSPYYEEAEAEVKSRGLQSKCVGQFYVAQNPKSFWGRVENHISLPPEKVFPVYTYKQGEKLLVALRNDDPRLQPTPENNFVQLFGSFDQGHQVELFSMESLSEEQIGLFSTEYHLFTQGKEEWNHFQKHCSVVPILGEGFLCIRIMEIRHPESTLSSETVAILNMTKPTFRFVRGGATVEARLLEVPVTLEAASSKDTIGQIFQDNWFSSDAAAEIIIGNNELKLLNGAARDLKNRTVAITVSRKDKYGKEESIRFGLRVVDYAPHTLIPSGLANNLVQWQHGAVEFKKGKFLKQHEIETALGSRRAKVFVENPKDIEAIQKEIAPLGYVVHHKLDLVENIRNLTRNMWIFVLVFNGSSFCLCLIILAGYACLVHSIKRNEFGTMLQMGIPRFCLIKGVLVEGIVYSAMALALAVVLILLLAAPYQLVLEQVFHMPKGVMDIGIISAGNTAYLPIGAIIMVGCLGMGTQIPAMWIAWFDKRPQKL